jgi:hypothetical protein
MEPLGPSELHENTDRFGGISYNVVKWPVCRSVVVLVTLFIVIVTVHLVP